MDMFARGSLTPIEAKRNKVRRHLAMDLLECRAGPR
jgi:hypothetical protein